MHILKRELKYGLKPFLLWTLGLFFLDFAGMIKFAGIETASGGATVTELLNKFPKVVLAVFGMTPNIDINSPGGFYSVLAYYAMICAAIYAVSLGFGAVSREAVDKTYEFIFTKPCSRTYILCIKLLSGFLYLICFCILHFAFSAFAIAALKIPDNQTIYRQVFLFAVSAALVSLIFFTLTAFLSAVLKRSEKGMLLGNLCFLFAFLTAIVCDMTNNDISQYLKVLTPLKYFSAVDLLNLKFDPIFIVICVLLSAWFFWAAVISFNKKDLNAA